MADVPPPPGAAAVRLVFGGVARLRRDRALHPGGVVLAAKFRPGGTQTGASLLDGGEERHALVRLSRGIGLPRALPDVLGVAVRIPDAYGPGKHQDFALASCGRRPLLRHALVAKRDFLDAFYSSLLPYRVGGERVLLGAQLAGDIELEAGRVLSIRIVAASPTGPWREVASLHADRGVDEEEARRLRFNPWNCAPDLHPIGFLNALRDPAYHASQRQPAR